MAEKNGQDSGDGGMKVVSPMSSNNEGTEVVDLGSWSDKYSEEAPPRSPLPGRPASGGGGRQGGMSAMSILGLLVAIIGLMASVALVFSVSAQYTAEDAKQGVSKLAGDLNTKADKVELVDFRKEVATRLADKADKVELEALARRSVVDQLSKELADNTTADAGRATAIAEIRMVLGSKADEARVKKLERRLRRRLSQIETDVGAMEAIINREGGVAGPPPPEEPLKKYIIP
jgi:hypothetical protein